MSTIEINKEKCEGFLGSGKRNIYYSEYQKTYAWTDEEVQTLFDDLVEYTQRELILLFLGTIVSYTNTDEEAASRNYEWTAENNYSMFIVKSNLH